MRGSTFAASVKGQIRSYPALIKHAPFLNGLLDKGNCIALFLPGLNSSYDSMIFCEILGLWLFFRKHRNGTRSVHLYMWLAHVIFAHPFLMQLCRHVAPKSLQFDKLYVHLSCFTFLHHMSCRCQIHYMNDIFACSLKQNIIQAQFKNLFMVCVQTLCYTYTLIIVGVWRRMSDTGFPVFLKMKGYTYTTKKHEKTAKTRFRSK